MAQTFANALAALLAREFSDFVSLLDCHQLSAGASQETWCIRYEGTSGEQLLALRRTQPTAQSASSVGGIELTTEARLLRLAAQGNVPVPTVRYVLADSDHLGKGFIMDWLAGETLGQHIVHSEELASVRRQLARLCGRALARIHALVPDTTLASALPHVNPSILVQDTWNSYRELDIAQPMIDYTARWLTDNLPTASRTTLVHGDFRNGNLMIDTDGICAVLDWELAHIGDPLRDLGWLCVNSWRFGRDSLPVGGFGETQDLLQGYEEESGVSVTSEELLFWQVFGSFWWSVATLQMAASWRRGETPSLERPVIGRRSSEAQMDCVNLLIPGQYPLPEKIDDLTEGNHLPMPAELLSGVRDFLKETAARELSGHDSFLARVAANSLGIAQREMLYGEQLKSAEAARLRALQDISGASVDALRRSLTTALRSGMALDTPGLAAHLRATTAGRLFIDQPRYPALKALPPQ